jgi:hypothetical protein
LEHGGSFGAVRVNGLVDLRLTSVCDFVCEFGEFTYIHV